MRRPFALRAEVVKILAEPDSKEEIPEPVHENACGERVIRRGEPLCKVESCGSAFCLDAFQEFRHRRLHDFSRGIHPIAALQYPNVARFYRHCDHGALLFRLEASDLGFDFFQLLLPALQVFLLNLFAGLWELFLFELFLSRFELGKRGRIFFRKHSHFRFSFCR